MAMKYQQLLVKEFEHWSVFMHENQCYLGRVYLWSKRKGAFDFIETSAEERREFFDIVTETKDVLCKLFQPDRFNYATLGNVCSHLHVHIIPRYRTKRTFKTVDFIDERWGKNYAPYNKSHEVSHDVLQELTKVIRESLII